MARPSCLHGGALAARLDREEPRGAGDRGDEVVLVVEDGEAARAEPAAGRDHRLVGQRRVEGATRAGAPADTPGATAVTVRPARAPPPISSTTSRSGRAHGDLADAGGVRRPDHGADDRAGRLVGAHLAEPAGALGHDRRDVGERLDVVDQRRGGVGLVVRARHVDVGGQAARRPARPARRRHAGTAARPAAAGGRPSIASSSAVSSPYRYSDGTFEHLEPHAAVVARRG